MGGMKFFTNISSLGLEGDTATPNSVIDAMPYRSALVVASSVFTNPAWNFPDGRYTLEIISVTGGRAIISLYGKTSTEAEYRMFLNNENNYPSGEWTKIVSNADLDTWVSQSFANNQTIAAKHWLTVDTGVVIPSGKTYKVGVVVYTGNQFVFPMNVYMDGSNRHIMAELSNISDSQVTVQFATIRVCYGN